MEQHSRDSILVVDDNKSNVDMLAKTLQKQGYIARTALSGKQALQVCSKLPPSIILLDIEMPEMDGYEVCRLLKQTSGLEDIPVIFLSAFTDKEYRINSFKVGGVDYIEKPFYVEEVLARVKTHLSLRKSQRILQQMNSQLYFQYQNTFKNAPIGIVNLSPKGKFLKSNQFFCEMLSYSENELVGSDFFDVIHPDFKTRYSSLRSNFRKKQSVQDSEIQLLSKNGDVVWADMKIEWQWDDLREPLYSILIVENISERIESEIRLNRSEQNLKEAQRIANLGSWEYVFKDKEFVASEEVFSIMGLSSEKGKISYQSLFRYIHPDDKARMRHDFMGFLKNMDAFTSDYRVVLRDNQCKYIRAKCEAEYSSQGELLKARGTIQDTTDWELLNERLERLALIARKTSNGVVITNEVGEIEWVNESFTRITDFAPADVQGKKPSEFLDGGISPEKELQRVIDALQHKKSTKVELQTKARLGKRIWLEIDIQPVFDEAGGLKHFVSLIRDVSKRKSDEEKLLKANSELVHEIEERKKLEKDLIKAKECAEQSDRLKSAFISNLSHEIRTPLNGIIGFANLLTSSDLDGEKKIFYRNILNDSCDNLLKIVEDILEVSRIQSGNIDVKSETVSLNLLIADLYNKYRFIANDKKLHLEMTVGLDDSSAIVSSDNKRLSQVLINLLDNAVKFTNEGTVSFGYTCDHQSLQFFVSDTGVGISEDMQVEVFKMFRQVELDISKRYGGTGIGLSIAQKVVEFMGGEMWLESEIGKGSTFLFKLPYLPVEVIKEVHQGQSFKTFAGVSFTILVAEDDPVNFLYMKEVLESIDVCVKRAVTGLEAVNISKEDPSIDLIIMDINMPVLDGIKAAREIKSNLPHLPVVAYTIYVGEESKKSVENAGFDGFLAKPIDPEKLVDFVNLYRNKVNVYSSRD